MLPRGPTKCAPPPPNTNALVRLWYYSNIIIIVAELIVKISNNTFPFPGIHESHNWKTGLIAPLLPPPPLLIAVKVSDNIFNNSFNLYIQVI